MKTEAVVLKLTGNALFDAGFRIPGDTDWQAVYEECKKQTVTVLGFCSAKQAEGLDPEVRKQWEKDVAAVAFHNYRVTFSHQNLHQMMEDAGIPYVILKGCASAAYYPRPMERLMGDVDFLVHKSDLERAGKVLEDNGFRPWEEEHICHVVYRNETEHLEMHFEPAGVPYGKAGEICREYFRDIYEQSQLIDYEGGQLRVPSAFHHGLVLLLHTSHHMLGEGIGLRHLCDWAVFAASFSEKEFRSIFEEKLKRIGLWKFACILTRTAERYLGCSKQGWAADPVVFREDAEADELTREVIRDIFTGGNFGRKQEGRVYETYLISSRGKDGVGRRNMFQQAIRSVNEMVYTHWPLAKRMKFLLPAGWTYYCTRYLIRIATGKRAPIHLRELGERARERRNVYGKFGLYEVEKDSL